SRMCGAMMNLAMVSPSRTRERGSRNEHCSIEPRGPYFKSARDRSRLARRFDADGLVVAGGEASRRLIGRAARRGGSDETVRRLHDHAEFRRVPEEALRRWSGEAALLLLHHDRVETAGRSHEGLRAQD